MRVVWVDVPRLQPGNVHPSDNDLRLGGADCGEGVVVDTDPGSDHGGERSPVVLAMEDGVAMQLRRRAQAGIRLGSFRYDLIEGCGQRVQFVLRAQEAGDPVPTLVIRLVDVPQ